MTAAKQFGLIGNNLKNTFSVDFFTNKFIENNLPFSYQNFELQKVDEITQLIESNQALAGLNITVPFKESVMTLLHELDITASAIGAVNCIKITKENI